MIDREDHRSRRCPRLGHDVTFGFCRRQHGGTLCSRILDCWWETFDVRAFLEAEMPEKLAELSAHSSSPPKLASILDLVEQARKRGGRD